MAGDNGTVASIGSNGVNSEGDGSDDAGASEAAEGVGNDDSGADEGIDPNVIGSVVGDA